MMRESENNQRIPRPSQKISDLLPQILAEISRKSADPREEIYRLWWELIGEKMAPLTEPVSFENGILTVKVKSSTLYSLLCQHEKPRLLKGMQEKFSIRNIVFRVG